MIPTDLRPVANVGNLAAPDMRMGVDPSAFRHIMGILTNLYSDQALAIIREYSTNAADSNIEAGRVGTPIHVSLPNHSSPKFVVRDSGVGLSLDEIREVYSQYGASTKRNSNDVNGMLGLGSKSALTYADQFTIVSRKNGEQITAIVTKDDDGVGVFKVLDISSTKEENGVTIEIPVPSGAVSAFTTKALEFYRGWEPGTVLIDGEQPRSFRQIVNSKDSVWVTPDILVERVSYERSRIVMGGVTYPHEFEPKGIRITAFVPIGSVTFAPSREALMYNASTKAVLEGIHQTITGLLVQRILEIANAGTEFEKNEVLYRWADSVPGISKHRGQVRLADPKRGYYCRNGKATRFTNPVIRWSEFSERNRKIVTDFPFANIGSSHKKRLAEYFNDKYAPLIILPAGTDLSAIAGHPLMVHWDAIVKATTRPKAEKAKATLYNYVDANSGSQRSAADFNDGKPVYYSTSGYYKKVPEIRQVLISERQVGKFLRLYPHAKTVSDYYHEEAQKAKAALTKDDRIWLSIRQGLFGNLIQENVLLPVVGEVLDPDLRRVIGLGKAQSATITRASALGVTLPSDQTLTQRIQDRYPLLYGVRNARVSVSTGSYNTRYIDSSPDILIYVNAKYRTLSAVGGGRIEK